MSKSHNRQFTILSQLRGAFGWGLYASIWLALLVIVLAYQIRPSYSLAIGGQLDAPYLEGVHDNEHDPTDPTITYRWTTDDAWLKLPGIGAQNLTVKLDMSGSRPAGFAAPQVTVSVAADKYAPQKQLAAWTLDPARQQYEVNIPREDIGPRGLFLNIHTANTFQPQGDSRHLGTLLFGVQALPADNTGAFIVPPTPDFLSLMASAALFALIMGICGWSGAGVALLGVLWAALMGGFLLFNRTWLALAEPGLLIALVAALLLALVMRPLLGWFFRKTGMPWTAPQRALLLTIFVVAFVFRLTGEMHPEIYIVDLIFHMHRFDDVLGGKLLFTIKSDEWNGHETFYLPTAYVFMAPLQWLLHDELLTIRLFTVGLATLGVFLIYYLARRATNSGAAGLLAATLYVTLPMAVLPFSWGITTDIFGQFFALATATLAVVAYERLYRPLVWIALVFLACMALLSHPGDVQLTGVLLVALVIVWALRGRLVGTRRGWIMLGAGLVCATALVVVVYYSHFIQTQLQQLAEIRDERAAANAGKGFEALVGGSVSDKSLGLQQRYVYNRTDWIVQGLLGFWQEAWAYFRGFVPLWAALGFLALPLVNKTRIARRFAWGAAAWAGVVFLFALVGLIANLYVRYSLFALPLVALGAGYLLLLIQRRGMAGRLMMTCVSLAFVVGALVFWYQRIQFAFK